VSSTGSDRTRDAALPPLNTLPPPHMMGLLVEHCATLLLAGRLMELCMTGWRSSLLWNSSAGFEMFFAAP